MDETFQTRAIILNRYDFNEDDSKVIVYSPLKGKLELVVRGAKKIKSKLAGHVEPVTLSDLMVVRGRQYDYVGNAVTQKSFANVKSDLDKLMIVGRTIGIFNKIIKFGQAEKNVYDLLENFLNLFNTDIIPPANYNLLASFFIFKLLIELGYQPELFFCVKCKNKIIPKNNKFDPAKGGIICNNCLEKSASKFRLTISENSIKLLRLIGQQDLNKLVKIKINEKLKKEVVNIVSSFFNYHFELKI